MEQYTNYESELGYANDIGSLSDTELVSYTKLGSNFSFSELYKRYYQKLLDFVSSFSISHPDEEDITQESFIRAHQHLNSLYHSFSFFRWLKKIAKQLIIAKSRIKFTTSELSDTIPSFDKSPESLLQSKEFENLFNDFINTLPPKEKEVIVSRLVEELPYRVLTEITGQNYEAARKTYKRAIRKARIFFKSRYEIKKFNGFSSKDKKEINR